MMKLRELPLWWWILAASVFAMGVTAAIRGQW